VICVIDKKLIMKKKNLITGLIAVAITAAVVYGYVYVAGKAWKKSTDEKK